MTSRLGNIVTMTPGDTPEIERKVAAQLGQRLLKILGPARVRSLSLHDAAGDLLWLSQGEFSDTQQRQVQDAQDSFALDRALYHLERDLEDTRALFFCTRTPEGDRTGLVFAIVSNRRRPDVDPAALRERVLTTLRRFASADAMPADEPRAAQSAAAEADAAAAADGADNADDAGSLRSRPYARLRPGGSTRRYEIADGATESLEQDLKRAARLIGLLKRRGTRDTQIPASFALPLCTATIMTSEFLTRLEPMLQETHLGDNMLGFNIPSAAWQLEPLATERFIAQCEPLRCFVALDDFDLARGGFGLLRGRALRCLKLDPALTANVLTDKVAHANVAAIAKAARVLGLYCVAKGVKAPATARWLASTGIEFADRVSRGGKGGSTTRRAPELALASGA